jgi:serine/threonine-protein kinase
MPDRPRTHLAPGVRIGGKYRLTRRLGEGAMGVVWAAKNESTGREVALKLLAGAEPQLRLRLLREARACGQLKHRNIVEIIDVGTTEAGEPFLVMELLVGETLAQRLKRIRRLDPTEAALVARDIARALTAAHARQVIHRDLKPANIFLQKGEADGAGFLVKVLDFGVSKDLAASDGLSTAVGAAVGSLAYMSPEQARAEPALDHRADLWSVGVMLFEMLAGERPLKGSAPQLMLSLARGEIPPVRRVVRGLDEGLAEIVDRCLRPRPEDRIGTAAELAALLEPYAVAPGRPAAEGEAPEPVAGPIGAQMPPIGADMQLGGADLPVGKGGTIRMSAGLARQIQAQLSAPRYAGAMEDPTTESTTMPRGQAPAPPPPVGKHGTELMLPLPAARPAPAEAPPQKHTAPPRAPGSPADVQAGPQPGASAMVIALIVAGVTAGLVAALVYGLLE